ncbi:SDR family oxidoreductase [Geodermatophilus sp. SYSU D00758]
MIVVTGAGGTTGAAVVRALRDRDRPVRAVVRTPRPAPAPGAEVVAADLTDAAGVEPLLAGAEALYLIWPNFSPGEAEGAAALFAAARRAGVPRVVYHSVLRPQVRAMPHHAAKDRAEEALDAAGLPGWRVLQPCAYSANLDAGLAEAARTGVLRSTWGLTRGQSFVDLRDVAEAAAVLLTEDGLDGGTFEAAGPRPLTAPQVAEALAARVGRPVRAVDVPPERPPADEPYAARCLRLMLGHYRAHGFPGSPRVLEALLGRPARTLADHLAGLDLP